MKKIGGFFELEIGKGDSLYHDDAIKLSTGRACLNLLLKNRKFDKVYIPFYCCDALFEPLELNKIEYRFYRINGALEIKDNIELGPSEAIVYCNYFGVKSDYVNTLIEIYGDKLILDNSHSFFTKDIDLIDSFTTARKYFGVADGAFLYLSENPDMSGIKRNESISMDHNIHSLLNEQELAFAEYKAYEKSLNSDINLISEVSERILKTVDYDNVKHIRDLNFNFYNKAFRHINLLQIDNNVNSCFCYPLLLESPVQKRLLHKEKIFIPSYWLDVLNRKGNEDYELECQLSKDLLPLPIDHRYGTNELEKVVDTIKDLIDE
jgi:hypothetical protein